MTLGATVDGRFRLEQQVAKGGMGVVYQARDLQTQRPAALKLILSDDPRFTARLANETIALLKLRHPAIVRYLAHGETSSHGLYLAMEWLEGVTLFERLKASPLGVEESLILALRLAEGLAVAHAAGMVHRDIKPSNILLVGGLVDEAKILDFGIVRLDARQHVTATGMMIGTPDYMAPEQVRGERGIGPAADVYSLGCVLFGCLTGRPVYSGENVAAVLTKVILLEQAPRVSSIRPDVPPFVDDLVARMLSRHAADRPADGEAAAVLIREAQRELLRGGEAASVTEARPEPSLTERERQPVSLIVVDPGLGLSDTEQDRFSDEGVLPTSMVPLAVLSSVDMVRRGPSNSSRIAALVQTAARPFDAEIHALIDGTFILRLTGGAAVTDLAVRAARCALQLKEQALPHASVGIATVRGEAGAHGGLAKAIDEATARLRRGSQEILLDKLTHRLLPARFAIRDHEDGGHELVNERPDTEAYERPRRLLGKQTPFVGRRTLNAVIAEYQDVVADSRPAASVVVGEAGMGKSRLRSEFVDELSRQIPRPVMLMVRGDPVRKERPLAALGRGLLGQLCRDVVGADKQREAIVASLAHFAEDDRRRLADFFGEICGVPFPEDDAPALRAARADGRLMRDQQRRAFEDWIVATAREHPVVVVVDDLQWLDHETASLIGACLRRASTLPVYVIALGRPEVRTRFPQLDEDWKRNEIRLQPLRAEECQKLIRAVLGDTVPPKIMTMLVERSDGHPFFLEELLRGTATGEVGALPDTVVDSILLRLTRLPEPVRRLLRAASVFGKNFQAAGVRQLLGGATSAEDVEKWVEVLEDEELVQRRDDGSFFIRHDLVRQAAYHMLTEDDRVVGHRLAGNWLVAAGETDPMVLAEHFAAGGAVEKAIDHFDQAAVHVLTDQPEEHSQRVEALRKAATYLRRAGEICAATYANDNAVAFYDRATAVWTTLDPHEAARTRLASARLRDRLNETDRARADLEQAEADVGVHEEFARTLIEVFLCRADLEKKADGDGALDRAWSFGERARDLAQSVGARGLEAKALTNMANTLAKRDGVEPVQRAMQLARLAVSLSSDSGDLAMSLFILANTFLIANDVERSEILYREALAMAVTAKNDVLVALCHGNLSMGQFRRWRLSKAIEGRQTALTIYQRVGDRTRAVDTMVNLGTLLAKGTDVRLAEGYLREVLTTPCDWLVTTACYDSLAHLERHRGQEDLAQGYLDAAARLSAKVGAPEKQALYLGLLAESYWASGQVTAAIDCLEKAGEATERPTLSHALILAQLGSFADAASLLETNLDTDSDADRRAGARLALARIRWWSGDSVGARSLCEEALGLLAPTPLPRFMLPAEALLACLDKHCGVAVASLRAATIHCSPYVADEVANDVGTLLTQQTGNASSTHLEGFLSTTETISNVGFRYRIEYLRCLISKALRNDTGMTVAKARAHEETNKLLALLPERYAAVFSEHPWVLAIFSERSYGWGGGTSEPTVP